MNTATVLRYTAALACALFLAAPVLAETVRGNGAVKTQARTAAGFSAVSLSIPARVELRQGDTEGVTIEADENLLPLIETRVIDGKLEIKPVQRHVDLDSGIIKVIVQARRIDSLGVGGSGSIVAESLRAPGKLSLAIGGAGSVDIHHLEAERVNVSIGGSGGVRLAGQGKRLDIVVGGSGAIKAPAFVADDVEVEVAGAGTAQVAARRKLDVTIAGAGTVSYSGDPQVERTIIGAGSIHRTGPLPQ